VSELSLLTPADEQPDERVVMVLRQLLSLAESGELRAVAMTGVVRHGPARFGGHYAWAGAEDSHRAHLIGGLSVVQAELVRSIQDELEDASE